MLSKKILNKGQVVIPKAIRDLLGIQEGDKVFIDVEGNRIRLEKKHDVVGKLREISQKHKVDISMKEIKEVLSQRHGG